MRKCGLHPGTILCIVHLFTSFVLCFVGLLGMSLIKYHFLQTYIFSLNTKRSNFLWSHWKTAQTNLQKLRKSKQINFSSTVFYLYQFYFFEVHQKRVQKIQFELVVLIFLYLASSPLGTNYIIKSILWNTWKWIHKLCT